MGNICKKLISGNRPGPKIRTVVPNITLPEDINFRHKSHPNREYPSNRVKTTKYTIFTFLPKNLFEQFHRYANIYFIFVALLNWIPGISAFGKEISMVPIFFVLSVTALKDAFEDFRRYQSDKRVNIASCRRYCRKAGRYVKSEWSQLYVGDFVHLSCNEIIPADILLLKSSDSLNLCHIETSNIDGETNLKQRFTATGLSYAAENFSPDKFTNSIECELPSADIYKFHGSIIPNDSPNQNKISINQCNLLLRGCLIRNTDFVEGIVIYAGPETKAMLNNRGPRYKRSKLERRMNRDLAYCVVILLFLCFFCAIGSGIWVGQYDDTSLVPFIPQQEFSDFSPLFQGFIVFWTYIIIFQAVIPLPLYVSLEIIKVIQVYFIQHDKELYYEPTDRRVECRALNITEDLGQVEYIFSDKTGTLTENQMEFKSCTIGGVDFPHGCDMEDSANDIRRSRYSMSNISRCSMDLINLKLEPSLQRDINSMSQENIDTSTSPQTRRVQDFFLLMAICNTVVVSPHPHEDQMDASGNLAEGSEDVTEKSILDRFFNSNGGRNKGKDNNGFRDEEDFGRSTTPSEGSIASTSILSEGTALGRYDAESPDEAALVKAASTYGCRLIKRMPTRVSVWLPAEGIVDYDVLHVLPFDSVRKRMSVIVMCPFSKEIILYTKGADSSILTQLKRKYREKEEEKRILDMTEQHLDAYAKKGLRTLCMAKKVMKRDDYEKWRGEHIQAENSMEDRDKKIFESSCRVEKDLDLLGATGIEDKLQEGVPETIANLRKAGIKIWVLTGDKQETAIQIAYASKLISPDETLLIINGRDKETTHDQLEYHVKDMGLNIEEEAPEKTSWWAWWKQSPKKEKKMEKSVSLIIDGRTLSYALHSDFEKLFITLAMNCSSVVCCRSTPIQKAEVVKLVRDELKQLTLAIGDGANDVSMIQTADVGVGISGQEGMQAVMASDFAIARFKFLQRLLLVHGHWCYDRLARFALYMFYKNPLPNLTIFWFQIFSGFTGSITMDSYYLLLLHVLFTAVPPAVNGVLDKDVSAKTLLSRHELYQTSQKGRSYTTLLFWAYVLDAFYQSLILHFVPNLTYSGSDTGLYEMGTTITVCLILTMLLFLGIETWCWTWIHWIILVVSYLMFWIFAIGLSAGCLTCDHPSNPYWVLQNTVVSPSHWLLVCLTCTLALLPRLLFRSFQTNLFPTEIQKARLDEKRGLITSPVRKSTKKKSAKTVNVELPASSTSLFKKQNRSVNGHRPATSSSVDVQVETGRSLSPSYRGSRSDSLESKEL